MDNIQKTMKLYGPCTSDAEIDVNYDEDATSNKLVISKHNEVKENCASLTWLPSTMVSSDTVPYLKSANELKHWMTNMFQRTNGNVKTQTEIIQSTGAQHDPDINEMGLKALEFFCELSQIASSSFPEPFSTDLREALHIDKNVSSYIMAQLELRKAQWTDTANRSLCLDTANKHEICKRLSSILHENHGLLPPSSKEWDCSTEAEQDTNNFRQTPETPGNLKPFKDDSIDTDEKSTKKSKKSFRKLFTKSTKKESKRKVATDTIDSSRTENPSQVDCAIKESNQSLNDEDFTLEQEVALLIYECLGHVAHETLQRYQSLSINIVKRANKHHVL